MDTEKPEQPADWCMVGYHKEITAKNCKCPYHMARRAAASGSDSAPAERGTRSLKRMVSLPARWLAKADLRDVQAAYADDEDETEAALLRREAATYRRCANALKRAGRKANARISDGEGTAT